MKVMIIMNSLKDKALKHIHEITEDGFVEEYSYLSKEDSDIQNMYKVFEKEYLTKDTPSVLNVESYMKNWLKGLPYCINVLIDNYEIDEKVNEWLSDEADTSIFTSHQEVSDYYYSVIAHTIISKLLEENGQ